MKRKLSIIAIALLFLLILLPGKAMAYTTGDDYPQELKAAARDSVIDPWRFLNRECTSFVAWCLNSRNDVRFNCFYMGPSWGDAIQWGYTAKRLGIKVDMNPAVGAVAWWDYGTYGHVAWVSAVNGDKVTIEEYNIGNSGVFNRQTIKASDVAGYIHIKDLEAAPYTGLKNENGKLLYYTKDKRDTSFTGLTQFEGNWYYVKKGEVDTSFTSIEQNSSGWWYVKNGKVDFSYTGFAKNANGWWYVEKGQVTFARNDIINGTANTDPAKAGEKAWWLVQDSKVVNLDTVAENSLGWWYVKNGKVDFTFKGFARNQHAWWYLENGKVSFGVNGVIQGNANSEPGYHGEDGWWLVKNSKVVPEDTVAENANGWWAIRHGKVDFGFTGFLKNEFGWWYLQNGKVGFDKNDIMLGIAGATKDDAGVEGWWYVRDSQVKNVDTVAHNSLGWWSVKGGKVDFNFTGFADNEYGWWYVENGKVTFQKNDILLGIAALSQEEHEGKEGWWFVRGSKVVPGNTVAMNSLGWWFVRDGQVDFSYTGLAPNELGWWYIKEGKVDFTHDGVEQNIYGWFRVEKGQVIFKFNGFADNKYGTWFLQNGKVNFSFTGTYDGKQVVNGKVQ